MFDYRLMDALVTVVEEGGFERAAKRLHLTQSAVSQRVKQLEEHLEARVRAPRRETAAGMTTTSAGVLKGKSYIRWTRYL